MAATLTKMAKSGEIPTDWLDLAQLEPLRPIHSDSACRRATNVLLALGKLPRMNRAQRDYFEVLSSLVADYEDAHYPIDTAKITVVEILESLMEDHGMTASDLGRMLGDRTLGHKILHNKRQLTVAQIAILAERFKVSTDLFIAH